VFAPAVIGVIVEIADITINRAAIADTIVKLAFSLLLEISPFSLSEFGEKRLPNK
jgi:hypothetical protein